jgi:hypothetical protein
MKQPTTKKKSEGVESSKISFGIRIKEALKHMNRKNTRFDMSCTLESFKIAELHELTSKLFDTSQRKAKRFEWMQFLSPK